MFESNDRSTIVRAVSTRRTAFTLVELLVVIGIIALLVAMLLPALQSAQRQAAMVQCQSNMRQVAMGVLMYIDTNKGKFPPGTVYVNAESAKSFPRGWWWPNEMVRGKFINAPSLYEKPGSTTASKKFNRSNVFRCPEGVPEDYLNAITNGQGLYPTHMLNNGYFYINDTQAAQDGLGIPSWYQLNARGAFRDSASEPTTAFAPPFTGRFMLPFMSYVTTSTHQHLTDKAFTRHMGQVKKASELVMLLEAASNNWYNRSATWPHWPRMGARHGKKTGDGKNASTNFAFFDGHVASYETVEFMGNQYTPGSPEMRYQAPIFFLGNQRPPN